MKRAILPAIILFQLSMLAGAQPNVTTVTTSTTPQISKLHLTPFNKESIAPSLRDGSTPYVVVSGVIDFSTFAQQESWKVQTIEFTKNAQLKLGSRTLKLDVERIVAEKDAVIVYTFDELEIPPPPPAAGNGRDGITRRGDGRDGANGASGSHGIEGTFGLSGGLLAIILRGGTDYNVKVNLRGQAGGEGGNAGNGGQGDSGNRGRRASDGPISCRSGGGDGGRGGNGGTGGNAGIGGKPGNGGTLLKSGAESEKIILVGNPVARGLPGSPGAGGTGASGGGGGHGSTYCSGGRGGRSGSRGSDGIIPSARYSDFGEAPSEL